MIDFLYICEKLINQLFQKKVNNIYQISNNKNTH